MQFKTLIFGNDAAQALRIKRLLYACTTYFFSIVFVGYALRTGLMHGIDMTHVVGAAIAINAGFYLAIRTGLNLRLGDPGLTIPQMAVGTLVNTYLIYHAQEARGAFLLGYVLILLFGIFRVRAGPTLLIGAIAVCSYAGVILVETMRGTGTHKLAVELLHLMMLAFIYPWFAQLGSHLNGTRANLRETNTRLAETLVDYERALEQIRVQATHDDLTSTYNRRHMIAAMEAEGERVKRGGLPFSILVLDVDHFKKINDRFGHPVGDRVLVQFAHVVQAQLRSVDQLGRYGGEEFLVLLPQTGLAAACAVAERVRAAVAEYAFSGLDHPVTVSIGAACAEPGEPHDAVFTRADRALYRAKLNGRNRLEN